MAVMSGPWWSSWGLSYSLGSGFESLAGHHPEVILIRQREQESTGRAALAACGPARVTVAASDPRSALRAVPGDSAVDICAVDLARQQFDPVAVHAAGHTERFLFAATREGPDR